MHRYAVVQLTAETIELGFEPFPSCVILLLHCKNGPCCSAERTGEARPAGAVVGALGIDAAGIGWAGHTLTQALVDVHVAVWALIPAPTVIRVTDIGAQWQSMSLQSCPLWQSM